MTGCGSRCAARRCRAPGPITFDFKRVRVKAWYVPTLLLMPLIMAVSFGVMRLTFRPAGFIPTQLSKGEPTSDRPAGGRVQAPRLGRDCGYLP